MVSYKYFLVNFTKMSYRYRVFDPNIYRPQYIQKSTGEKIYVLSVTKKTPIYISNQEEHFKYKTKS